MKEKNLKVDNFLKSAKKWPAEMKTLREICLSSGLTEELKWRLPCYELDDSNVAIIQPFKEYCAIMFFKGALLKDTKKLLDTPGTSQSVRQLRFTDIKEIEKKQTTIKAYIKEAIKIEKSGLQVEMKKTSDFEVPEEFQAKLNKNAKLKTAFAALTPGRQRAYLFFFAQAKQSKTREARIEKFIPSILKGKGMND
jgi:uncharacterized protein YdeI (YjbR/CyaY-like superfamily)